MELQIAKRYPVAASVEQAWTVLADVRAVAACMPGAQISEQLDDARYAGRLKARVGPAALQFDGEIELEAVDAVAHRIALTGKGKDATSAASLSLSAQLDATPEGCVLVGSALVRVSGKLAQIGNRLLVPASDALLAQFAQNFSTAAAARAAAPALAGGALSAEPPLPAPHELSAADLLWRMLKAWWAGLWGKR